MDKALETRIEEMKQEAINKDLLGKSTTIAKYLRKFKVAKTKWLRKIHVDIAEYLRKFPIDKYNDDDINIFNQAPFHIRVSRYPTRVVSVDYNGSLVFMGYPRDLEYPRGLEMDKTRGKVSAYIPGDWEKDFEIIYHQALEVKNEVERRKAEEELKKKEAEERGLLERFGLLKG